MEMVGTVLRGDHIMRNLRFNIASILGVILFLGIGFAALRESNDYWESGMFTLTVGALLVSILLSIHRSEAKRAYWIGFALFGWVYLALSLAPSIEARLLTTKGLACVDSKMHESSAAGFAYFDYDNDGSMDLYVVNNPQPSALYRNLGNGKFQDVTATTGFNLPANATTASGAFFLSKSNGTLFPGSVGTLENFVRIGHSLIALIAAFFGGYLSRHLYHKNLNVAQRRAGHLESTQSDAPGG